MSKKKIEQKVRLHAAELIEERGYISPIDLLVKMDRLKPKQVEDWRFKRIPYLEKIILGNLDKLDHILRVLKQYAEEENLKASITVYKSWGKGPKKELLFSKFAKPHMEKLYSTHYVQRKM